MKTPYCKEHKTFFELVPIVGYYRCPVGELVCEVKRLNNVIKQLRWLVGRGYL